MDTQQPQGLAFLQDATLVFAGGVIGLLSGLILAARQRRHERKQKERDERRSYKAWLTGLRAELNHILTVITEITGIVDQNQLSTKRINSDFLQEARLVIFKHDEDTDFLGQLTTAFRDVVHTNGMLDRVEANHAGRHNLRASLDGVRASVEGLSRTLDVKLKRL